ncbi:hypothetical protein SUGI_1455510 [Cryptomeria japonica]|uniref:Uncharacterized protein n=1 Tax=Cryptomeria japonica TaxID=3369 RepID=A0AAD3RR69_CRYJA|nr:hypothetical protein SUGI_1424740 [Cryptomeria japonica]GLJ58524.1 hypothetical protein SUGI_1455510 [Cryptomeria japonica]
MCARPRYCSSQGTIPQTDKRKLSECAAGKKSHRYSARQGILGRIDRGSSVMGLSIRSTEERGINQIPGPYSIMAGGGVE